MEDIISPYSKPIDACFKIKGSRIISDKISKNFSGVVVTSDTNQLNSEREIKKWFNKLTSSLPKKSNFKIFMTLNVNLYSDHNEIITCYKNKSFFAGRLKMETLSLFNEKNRDKRKLFSLFRLFEENKIPLYLSLKKSCNSKRGIILEEKKERFFIKHCLPKIIEHFPALIFILEDMTTKKAINFISSIHPAEKRIYAIISPISLGLEKKTNNTQDFLTSPHFRFFFGTVKNSEADYSTKLYKKHFKTSINKERIEYLSSLFLCKNFQILL